VEAAGEKASITINVVTGGGEKTHKKCKNIGKKWTKDTRFWIIYWQQRENAQKKRSKMKFTRAREKRNEKRWGLEVQGSAKRQNVDHSRTCKKSD